MKLATLILKDIFLPDVVVDKRLQEISFGSFEEYLLSDILSNQSKEIKDFDTDQWNYKINGGENYPELCQRLHDWGMEQKKPCVVFSHGVVARVFLSMMGNVPKKIVMRNLIPHEGVVHFKKNDVTLYQNISNHNFVNDDFNILYSKIISV